MHKGAAALLWGETAHDGCQRLLLATQRAAGVGGTLPPRLSPGGGNGKGGDRFSYTQASVSRPGRVGSHHTRSLQRLRAASIRSPQSIWKWFSACFQCWMESHLALKFRKARYSNFNAASSLGNDPRVLIIFR